MCENNLKTGGAGLTSLRRPRLPSLASFVAAMQAIAAVVLGSVEGRMLWFRAHSLAVPDEWWG